MKNVDIGRTLSILANAGVIAGIVFLAIELRQNNEYMAAQAGYNLLQNRLVYRSRVQENPAFAELMAKMESGNPLTAKERVQVSAWFESMVLQWQWEFQEYRSGRLGKADLPVEGIRRMIRREPSMRAWSDVKAILTPPFIEWMESEVIPE